MQCPKCNSPVEAGDEFCGICAAPLAQAEAQPAPAPAPAKPASTGLFKPPALGGKPAAAPPTKPSGLFQKPKLGAPPPKLASTPTAHPKPKLVCQDCGPQFVVDDDGVCTNCGNQVVVTHCERDDFRVTLSAKFALRSFLGKVHSRNEDFAVIATESKSGRRFSIGILSDGVSSAEHSEITSKVACEAALAEAIAQIRSGETDVEKVALATVVAAESKVAALPRIPELDERGKRKQPPEATFIVSITAHGATAADDVAALAWVGDTRAYLVNREKGSWSAKLLSKDHSWVNQMVDAKLMTIEQGEALLVGDYTWVERKVEAKEITPDEGTQIRRNSHAIYQSLGPVEDGEIVPGICKMPLANSYALLLCTDGFWNSQHTHQNQPPQGLLDLLATLPAGADAAAVAEKCVSTANDQDGGDNITVIVQFT